MDTFRNLGSSVVFRFLGHSGKVCSLHKAGYCYVSYVRNVLNDKGLLHSVYLVFVDVGAQQIAPSCFTFI